MTRAIDRTARDEAARELASLRVQTAQARHILTGLQQSVADASAAQSGVRSAQLVEANEHLLVAALQARTQADAAAQALNDVARSAQLDVLTGLPNRLLMLDRLASAIAHAKRNRTWMAVLFVDLDDFKSINDSFGHATGDAVLGVAARSLVAAVRAVDTVSRHGGDEFLVLLSELSHAADAALIARKIIAALAVPQRVGEHVLGLKVSIGISICPDDGQDAESLIEHADAAMYRVKGQGLGGFAFHGATDVSGSVAPPAPAPAARRPASSGPAAPDDHEPRHAVLREANERLVLAALDAQALKAAAELAQRRQTELLALVVHELRSPLMPLRLAAERLIRVPPAELPKLQAVIQRQVSHMARLVADLLDVSRVNTGKLRLDKARIDIAEFVEQSLQTCRPAMVERDQRLVLQAEAGPHIVEGDPVRLAQVLCNLFDNASKYTPANGEITLSIARAGGSVVLSVSDNGIGIAADVLPEIFEPFVQDTHAIAANGVGLGLGLTVVRELVVAHGGKVEVFSAGPDLGSRFVVSLPLAADP